MKQFIPIALLLSYGMISCKKNDSSAPQDFFDSIPVSKPLLPLLNEVSGIADSKINPGYVWGEEDSGAPSQIHLIGHDGHVVKTIVLKDITNRDWEDMVLAGGQIYIAETGDNSQAYPDYSIYQFPEPLLAVDTIKNIQSIRFTYSDGSHDAEAFLVDPNSKDIFIITKRDNPSRIYKLSSPFGATNMASIVGTLPYTNVVSAAQSNGNDEIIVKTYTDLYHYTRSANQTIAQALQNNPAKLKYQLEPQGEAISFAIDNSGFYTLSEKGFASSVNLNFYNRK